MASFRFTHVFSQTTKYLPTVACSEVKVNIVCLQSIARYSMISSSLPGVEVPEIPNFLHLTPSAIKKHCLALKVFCTDWPKALDSDEKVENHFPVEIETSDYIFSGPSLRHPMARVVKLNVKLSHLELDLHARRKLIKLVGDRYDKDTDTLTITADRCPTKKQNRDYALYLLTVLYHESWKTEAWEADKTDDDMEEFIWENSVSQKNIINLIENMKEKPETLKAVKSHDDIIQSQEVLQYKTALKKLHDEKECLENVEDYKEAVKKILLVKSS
uniref:28S ribosomal protein S35, mitochondrial-like n=1 Tax=Saccoglossus kowalevskii TaxID=10224 RepID=A0ABM0MH94_SACKO|nr:PREDICTED: 28S ribosomal protein S35, mitochondrial-like [Saccoglossus kowalevskii]